MNNDSTRVDDDIYAAHSRWTFAGNVCDKFDRHVIRSVPLYREGHQMVLNVSDFFVGPGSVIYDLGCSTGSLSKALAMRHADQGAHVNAIDIESGMVKKAQQRCYNIDNIEIIAGDFTTLEIATSDFIVAYYTMQFIRPRDRQEVYDKIYQALNWGGGLFLFDKVRASDARFQDMNTQLYQEFKIDNGFGAEEIVAKSRSLKGILEPYSSRANLDFLQRAGFKDTQVFMKYLCFEGLLAIK
jgi:tRNA (cmo5U34)-methyltransferase